MAGEMASQSLGIDLPNPLPTLQVCESGGLAAINASTWIGSEPQALAASATTNEKASVLQSMAQSATAHCHAGAANSHMEVPKLLAPCCTKPRSPCTEAMSTNARGVFLPPLVEK